MGITISYRGSLDDLDRVEDFEDRVLDLALELEGQARIWRSAKDDPRRMVRGLMLNLFPGQETTSLLLSPEGWLINPCEIEEAEKGELAGPPWCFVKTQFGPIEGHVALIELLTVLKREFFPNLEVRDEGRYWETRNLPGLARKIKHVQAAIDGLAEGLDRFGLSREAAEDSEILLRRIERIAGLVHRTLTRPVEHPPVTCNDEESAFGHDHLTDESRWDASYKENRRRQERIERAIEERVAQGADVEEAFEAAMREETAFGLPDESPESEASDDGEEDIDAEADEPWRESLGLVACESGEGERPSGGRRHPLQQRVTTLLLRLHKLFGDDIKEETKSAGGHLDVLFHGACETGGGLAQALGDLPPASCDESDRIPFPSSDDEAAFGLAVVQLKRALRGIAFALGALFSLRAAKAFDDATFDELHATFEQLQSDVYAELARCRQRHAGEL